MTWRAPDQEVDQRRHGKRLRKEIAKFEQGRCYGSWEMEEADKDWMMIRMVGG